jgi:hypothetical protein
MIRFFAAVVAAAVACAPAVAQDADGGAFDFSGDAFRAGGAVVFAEPDGRDVFLAGERVDLAAPIAGSAHLAGRRVESAGAVGGALYAFGADVRVTAPVAGAATLAGYDVAVDADVGGNLRAAGSTVEVGAPVAGGALLAGERVVLGAAIAGDASIAAEQVSFGEGARVDGRLTILEDAGRPVDVPPSVAPPERVDRRIVEGRGRVAAAIGPGWPAVAAGFVISVLIVALLAALMATLAPRRVGRLRAIVADGPFRALGAGFLAQSALVGATVLLALTLVGIVIAPFALIAAALLGFLGYLVAVYVVGVWAVTRAGALEPDSFPEHLLAAGLGALILSLVGLAPFLGWLALLAAGLIGAGAIAIAMLRPRFERA